MTTVLSFDLGASNGRLLSQKFDGSKLKLKEIHRFTNQPLQENGHYYWDFDYLMKEITGGIRLAQTQISGTIGGIGVDTWGVDFGIVDENGELASKPFSYRDAHTIPYMKETLQQVDAYELFSMTGNEVSSINTLFQLLAIEGQNPELLRKAKHILMMPNLIQYALTGIAQNEFTIASTSQMTEKNQTNWHKGILENFFQQSIPLADIYMPHTVMGEISNSVQQKEGLSEIPVILTPGHDTACALSALPIKNANACFISIGTWALVGKEVDRAVINEDAFKEGFTNEGTSEGKYRFQRNGMGFWIVQNLRNEWKQSGHHISYEEESELLKNSRSNGIFIDPDDDLFFNPVSMERAIRHYCLKTGQAAPSSIQETLRCIIESMALKYAYTIDRLEYISGEKSDVLYIGGGGIQNKFLCQFIADATNKQVMVGPVEASAIGNGLSQLRALGEIKSIQEGRKLVEHSFEIIEFNPQNRANWQNYKDQMMSYIK